MGAFAELESLPPQQLFDGIAARVIHGELITLGVLELDPGAVVGEHSHPNEQLGICLRGSIILSVGDEKRDLRAGGTWRIASGMPHSARAGAEGAVVIDVFSPVRADWEATDRPEPRKPRWP